MNIPVNFSASQIENLLNEELSLDTGRARDGWPYQRQTIHTNDEYEKCLSKMIEEVVVKYYKI